MALIDETPFNWKLPPAPGYPGYQPKPQAQPRPPATEDYMQKIGPTIGPDGRPVSPPATTVDGRPLTSPDDSDSGSNEPYIPSRADRPPDQWGTPDQYLTAAMGGRGMAPGPYMPQHNDIAGLLHGIVMGMGRYGSHYSGMPAIAMGNYASAYWKAYQAGMKERAGTAWQQYQQSRQMFLDRQKEEFQAESEAYALYQDNPDKLHAALEGIAHKYGDQTMLNALASGNTAAVDRLLQKRDSHFQDAAKIKQQEENQKLLNEERRQMIQLREEQEKRRQEQERQKEEQRRRIDEERKKWDPSATGPGPGYAPPDATPDSAIPVAPDADVDPKDVPDDDTGASATPDTTSDTAASTSDAPDATSPDRPIQVADASGTVPIGSSGQPPSKPAPGAESAPIERAAKDWVFTHKLPASLDKKLMPDIAARIERRGGQIEDQLDRITNAPNLKGDAVIDAVRDVLPDFANELKMYINGDAPPPRAGTANNPYWRRVYSLGRKVDPQFTADTFAERAKARQFWTSGSGGNKLTSVATAYDHLKVLRDDIKKGMKPYPLVGSFLEHHIPGMGGTIGRFEADLRTALHEYENALASSGAGGGGAATIPALKDETEQLSVNQTDESMLGNIEAKIERLGERFRELQNQYESSTGRPATEIMKRFDEINKQSAQHYKDSDPKYATDLEKASERLQELQRTGGKDTNDSPSRAPKAGTIENGWKFKGGDPGKQENWEKQ